MPTYDNIITEKEVSLAIQRFLIAPYGTTWTPARIWIDSTLPSSFIDLGAVVEDTPTISATREKFKLVLGIPGVLRYEAVLGINAEIGFALHSHSGRKVKWALGNVNPVQTVETTPWTTVATATSKMQLGLTGTPGVAWYVDDVVATDTESLIKTTDNVAQISSINAGTIYFHTPGLFLNPTVTHKITKVSYIQAPFGTSKIIQFHLLGVADFIDGIQVVHSFQKVAPKGEFGEAIKPTENVRIPLAFDAYGYISTIYGADRELIVGERFWFPKATS